jgi:tetratricopeptide (TPR) repeat protein
MYNKDYDDHLHNLSELVKKYEQAHQNNEQLFFDESDLEDIIDYYLDNLNFESALNVANEGIDLFGFSATFYQKKAEILIETQHYDDAWQMLEIAESYAPKETSIALLKADVLTYKGEYKEAVAIIEEALNFADEEDKADMYLELADVYEEWEKYWEVIDCLQLCLEIQPENEEALNRLWFAVELTESYEDSIAFHKNFLNENPYSVLGWYNLGNAYYGLKMHDKAIEAFEYVIAIDDEFESAYYDLADIYYYSEDYKKAIENYNEALERGGNKKELYYNIGKCYHKMKNTQKAREFYKKSINVDPYFAKAFHKIGKTYLENEMEKNAISPLERAIKLDGKNVDYLKSLAEAYIKNDALDEAIELYEKALKINELDKTTHLLYVTALFERGSIAEAIEHLNKVIFTFSEDRSLLYIKAALLFDIGKRSRAFHTLETALQFIPHESYKLFDMLPELLDDEEVILFIDRYKS